MITNSLMSWVRRKASSRHSRLRRKSQESFRRALRTSMRIENLEARQLLAADLDVFLTTEHVDLNIGRVAEEWQIGPRPSGGDSHVLYPNDKALHYVGDAASHPASEFQHLPFIGAGDSQSLYVLPQSGEGSLLYLGLSAYDIPSGSLDKYIPSTESKGRLGGTLGLDWAKATLVAMRHTNPDGSPGVGNFSAWQVNSAGAPVVFMATYNDGISNANANGLDVTDGISSDDALWINVGGHLHYNFAFTRPGRYEIDLKLSGYVGNDGNDTTPNTAGFSESSPITLYFTVKSVGELQFDAASYQVNENAGSATIDVVRVGGSDGRILVNYATSNGTAVAGEDYAAASGQLIFNDGETRKTITIPILQDTEVESDETFQVTLSAPGPANLNGYKQAVEGDSNGLLGAIAQATVTINGQSAAINKKVPFDLPSYYGTEVTPHAFESLTADFDGDGKIDLVTAGNGIHFLSYLGGVGDGTFQPARVLNGGTNLNAHSIALADYNGDGKLDIVALETDPVTNLNSIAVFLNDGNAIFTRQVLATGLTYGYDIFAEDMNGDGRPDIVYSSTNASATFGPNVVSIALQEEDGRLGTPRVLSEVNYLNRVFVKDLDLDGDMDLIIGDALLDLTTFTSITSTHILKNGGDATFSSPEILNKAVYDVRDMNEDGLPDFVTIVVDGTSRVGYFPQQLGGTWGGRVNLHSNVTQLNGMTVSDLNKDGIPDLVIQGIAGGTPALSWSPGLGDGTYGDPVLIAPHISNTYSLIAADLDNDGDQDLILVGSSGTAVLGPTTVFLNKWGEDPAVLLPPAARSYVAGDTIELSVYLGFPITVSGTPRIPLEVGSRTVYATYVQGSGTGTLRFSYTVTEQDVDLDGVQLVGNLIDLNGGSLVDPNGESADPAFPGRVFEGVVVNGAGPLVTGIQRTSPALTELESVQFTVRFNRNVSGVDASDFQVIMNAGDLAGAVIQSVTGEGDTYVVTVSTGTGSGTLGLHVRSTASITDANGHTLGKGYPGGEVYTVRRTLSESIDTFYTQGHADYRPILAGGEFSLIVRADTGVLPNNVYPSDELYTYANSSALVSRNASANYDFVGVGAAEPYYVLPSSNSPGLPYLGFSGEGNPVGSFAKYRPSDPRITSATTREYLKIQMVDMRSSSGGDFSIYSISGGNPVVWMATSDGISENDSLWLYQTHFHRNVAFSKPGIYEIDVVISGYLDDNQNGVLDVGVDSYVESGIKTMVFAVGLLQAKDDSIIVVDQQPLQGSVTQNDLIAPELGLVSAEVVSGTTHGTLLLQPNGSFVYTPGASFAGTDSFVYRLSNAHGIAETATVTIGVNRSPIAQNDSYTIAEDGVLASSGSVLDNDTDSDGDSMTASLVAGPQNGKVTFNPDGTFTYTPNPDFHGTDTFTYTVTDARYDIIPLGTLGGNNSFALALNNLRQVTGNSSTNPGASNPLNAFLWDFETRQMVSLGRIEPGANFSRGYAINDSGVVVGESDNDRSKAFLYQNGGMINLGTLGGTTAVATAIGPTGIVVGASNNGTTTKPFVYLNGVMTELPTLAGNPGSTGRAWGISPDGEFIVGLSRLNDAAALTHATLWQRQSNGSYEEVDMGSLVKPGNFSQAYAVNDRGAAVGSSVVGTVSPTSSTQLYHGFYWIDDSMIDIGTLSQHGTYIHSEAKDINASGQFVGYVALFHNSPTFGAAAFVGEVVDGHAALVDLNNLIPAGSGWQSLFTAESINDGRDIVGYGRLAGTTTTQAFLLVPAGTNRGGSLFGNVATVTIEVTPVNDAPTAVDDHFSVTRGGKVFGNVLFNDFDVDGDAIAVSLNPTALVGGVMNFNSNGSFTYVPTDSFVGTETFTYTLTDAHGVTSIGTVVITIGSRPDIDTVISSGHVDIGVVLGEHDHGDDGEDDHGHDHGHSHDHDAADDHGEETLSFHIHDHANDVEYHPDEALLYVGSSSKTLRADGFEASQFAFLGVAPGESFWLLRENPITDQIHLGFGTEEIAAGSLLNGRANIQLKSVSGPGHFALWKSGDTSPRMATIDGIDLTDQISVLEASHTHFNFSFSAPGFYQITFQAFGNVADGDPVSSDDFTFYFQVGNGVTQVEVANGQSQRSFLRDIDLAFATEEGLEGLLNQSRVRITQYDLNGQNGFDVVDPARRPSLSVSANVLHLDWGAHGIGGNRGSTLGDGYYRVSVDLDGDGVFDSDHYFHRLFGDMDGDGRVTEDDIDKIVSLMASKSPEGDVDGNGAVNAIDRVLAGRSLGRQLSASLRPNS